MALSPRSVERRDAHSSPQWNRIANHGAADCGLTAVGRVAEREAGHLETAAHRPAFDFQAGRGDPVVEAGDLAIEARQLALAQDVDEPGPGFAIKRLGLRR